MVYHYSFSYCKSLYFQYITQKYYFLCLTYMREKKILGICGSVTESICQSSPYLYFSHSAIRTPPWAGLGKCISNISHGNKKGVSLRFRIWAAGPAHDQYYWANFSFWSSKDFPNLGFFFANTLIPKFWSPKSPEHVGCCKAAYFLSTSSIVKQLENSAGCLTQCLGLCIPRMLLWAIWRLLDRGSLSLALQF